MKLLVTGATGFVGREVVKQLLVKHIEVICAVRADTSFLTSDIKTFVVGDISEITDWSLVLSSIDVIIHLAARVHVMNDTASNPLDEFRKVNVHATLSLAKQAAEAGVRRFIFISSVKVNGEFTSDNHSFTSGDKYMPNDPYGLSKYEAEQGLLTLAKETGMEVVIIRPPLVYGLNVKANFRSMMKWVNRQIPLPLGAFIIIDHLLL